MVLPFALLIARSGRRTRRTRRIFKTDIAPPVIKSTYIHFFHMIYICIVLFRTYYFLYILLPSDVIDSDTNETVTTKRSSKLAGDL